MNDRHGFTRAIVCYFKERPNRWIPHRKLMAVGGACGWRTRISNARKKPYYMVIPNKPVKVRRGDRTWTISFYKYVPAEPLTFQADGQANFLS